MIAHLIILIHLNLTHIVLMTLNLLMDFILIPILVTNLTNDRMTILMIANRNRITVFLDFQNFKTKNSQVWQTKIRIHKGTYNKSDGAITVHSIMKFIVINERFRTVFLIKPL